MGKNKFRRDRIILPLLILGLGTGIYSTIDLRARGELRTRLEKKVNTIADINSNNILDIKEASKVYENLGLGSTDELRKEGFNLSIGEMQKYLESMEKFDPETDNYCFSDGFRR